MFNKNAWAIVTDLSRIKYDAAICNSICYIWSDLSWTHVKHDKVCTKWLDLLMLTSEIVVRSCSFVLLRERNYFSSWFFLPLKTNCGDNVMLHTNAKWSDVLSHSSAVGLVLIPRLQLYLT
jgi:hypothetical protein